VREVRGGHQGAELTGGGGDARVWCPVGQRVDKKEERPLALRKKGLSPAQVKQLRKRLEEERKRLETSLEDIEARTSKRDLLDAMVEEQDFDDAPSDAAMDTLDRGTEMALEDNIRVLLEEVAAAVAKIDRGTYGVCDNCGQPIKMARLERIPWATMCVECQERMERR
jgi:RNA polymerase-binding protein DksA